MDGQNFENQTNVEAEVVETTVVEEATQTTDNYQDYTADVQTQTVVETTEAPKTSGLAVTSLVLGISAIVFSCCCGLGFVLGIIGIICAIVANKKGKSGVGTAGLICSIIGTVFGLFGLVYWIYCFVIAANMTPEMLQEMGYYY